MVELLSQGGAGLFLEAQGHNLGEGPALGSKQHSLVMIKWEAGLFDLSAPSGTPPDAFQQNGQKETPLLVLFRQVGVPEGVL